MSFVEMSKDNKERKGNRPCILVHGFDESALSIIKKICLALDIDEMITISAAMQNNVIQDIIDGNVKENALLAPLNETVIIFNDLSDHDIHEFISGFKNTGIKRPIYAASTQSSRKWTFKNWLTELMEEREALKQQQAMSQGNKKS